MAKSLLEKLKNSSNTIHSVRLSDGLTVGLRILNEQDYIEAAVAVEQAMQARKVEFSATTAELFEDEKATQLLSRALVDPKSKTPISEDAEQLREALNREQRQYLTEEYLSFEKDNAPSGRTMDDAEFTQLFETLKKTPDQIHLSDLSTDTLKRLFITLVNQQSS